ncbi:MAG: sugar ABC transporter permease [Clostridia bacterium]|nr:sugar ABC transporter permease [Clostridia bacterium]
MGKKSNRILLSIRKNWQLYLFLLPPLIYLFLFHYRPMAGIVIAFKDYSIRKGVLGSPWVGSKYFTKFFQSYQANRVIRNTLILSIYQIAASFPVPILFALMINSVRADGYRKFVQATVNLPHFISTTVMVGILMSVLNPRVGLYGQIYETLLGVYPRDPLATPGGFRSIYVWSGVWQSFGWDSVVYTAALAGVDPTYHEAAELDGATRFQRAVHIDLPCIAPTIVIMLILRMGSLMNIGFEKVYLMQNPLNLDASSTISTYVYSVGLALQGSANLSYATAIGLFNSVVNLILITGVNKIAGKLGETSLW